MQPSKQPQQCETCKRWYANRANLRRHTCPGYREAGEPSQPTADMQPLQSSGPFYCRGNCGLKFSKQTSVSEHMSQSPHCSGAAAAAQSAKYQGGNAGQPTAGMQPQQSSGLVSGGGGGGYGSAPGYGQAQNYPQYAGQNFGSVPGGGGGYGSASAYSEEPQNYTHYPGQGYPQANNALMNQALPPVGVPQGCICGNSDLTYCPIHPLCICGNQNSIPCLLHSPGYNA